MRSRDQTRQLFAQMSRHSRYRVIEMNRETVFSVAIGGPRGSETRVVAMFLHMLVYVLGNDLSEAVDNHYCHCSIDARDTLEML